MKHWSQASIYGSTSDTINHVNCFKSFNLNNNRNIENEYCILYSYLY